MALDRYVLANYAEDLAKLVNKVLMLCEVAALARDCRMESFGGYKKVQLRPSATKFGITQEEFDGIVRSIAHHDDDDYASQSRGGKSLPNEPSYHGNDPRRRAESEKMKIKEMLGAWYVCCPLIPMETRSILPSRSVSQLFQGRSRR